MGTLHRIVQGTIQIGYTYIPFVLLNAGTLDELKPNHNPVFLKVHSLMMTHILRGSDHLLDGTRSGDI